MKVNKVLVLLCILSSLHGMHKRSKSWPVAKTPKHCNVCNMVLRDKNVKAPIPCNHPCCIECYYMADIPYCRICRCYFYDASYGNIPQDFRF